MSTETPKPTLYVCHGDDGGPRVHPCRRVQERVRALPDGTVLKHSRAIMAWADEQGAG